MIFEIIKTTEKLKKELHKLDLDDVTVGAWEIKIIWEGGYTEWYRPYRTKKDDQDNG